MSDQVAKPRHHKGDGTVDAMQAMTSMMTGAYWFPVKTRGKHARKRIKPISFVWWGFAFKYLWRWVWKNGIQDLKKCRQCIDYLIATVEEPNHGRKEES